MPSERWNPSVDVFGECAREGCTEPCPWDMAAVMLGDATVCCSPACAESVLASMDATPDWVALHDPQGAVDRDDLPEVDDTVIDIRRRVTDREDAEHAIQKCAEMHPARFRGLREEDGRG